MGDSVRFSPSSLLCQSGTRDGWTVAAVRQAIIDERRETRLASYSVCHIESKINEGNFEDWSFRCFTPNCQLLPFPLNWELDKCIQRSNMLTCSALNGEGERSP